MKLSKITNVRAFFWNWQKQNKADGHNAQHAARRPSTFLKREHQHHHLLGRCILVISFLVHLQVSGVSTPVPGAVGSEAGLHLPTTQPATQVVRLLGTTSTATATPHPGGGGSVLAPARRPGAAPPPQLPLAPTTARGPPSFLREHPHRIVTAPGGGPGVGVVRAVATTSPHSEGRGTSEVSISVPAPATVAASRPLQFLPSRRTVVVRPAAPGGPAAGGFDGSSTPSTGSNSGSYTTYTIPTPTSPNADEEAGRGTTKNTSTSCTSPLSTRSTAAGTSSRSCFSTPISFGGSTTSTATTKREATANNMAQLSEEAKGDMLMQLISVIGEESADVEVARALLESSDWNLEMAINLAVGGGDRSPLGGAAQPSRAPGAAYNPAAAAPQHSSFAMPPPASSSGESFGALIGPNAMTDDPMGLGGGMDMEEDAELQAALAESSRAHHLNRIVDEQEATAKRFRDDRRAGTVGMAAGASAAPTTSTGAGAGGTTSSSRVAAASGSASGGIMNSIFAHGDNPNHGGGGRGSSGRAAAAPVAARPVAVPAEADQSDHDVEGGGIGEFLGGVMSGIFGTSSSSGAPSGAPVGASSSRRPARDSAQAHMASDEAMARAVAASMNDVGSGLGVLSEQDQMEKALKMSKQLDEQHERAALRMQQEMDLKESELMDQMRERKEAEEKAQQEAIRKQAEEEQAKQEQAAQDKKSSVRARVQSLGPEPADGDPNKLALAFRLPSGKKLNRCFSKTANTVQHLYDFVDGQLLQAGDEASENMIGDYALASSFPKFTLEASATPLGATKVENRMLLVLQTLS